MRRRSWGHVVAAIFCAGIALFLIWAGATRHRSLQVPPGVSFLTAWVFGVAALRLVQLHLRPSSPGDGSAALMAGGMAGIGAWIALGPGARQCAMGSEGVVAEVGGASCRIPFGIGAAITLAIAVYAAHRWARGGGRGKPKAQ